MIVSYQNVTKTYPDKTVAVHNVSFSVSPKEFVTIVGHSGAGKTSLTRLLIGEERPTTGSVHFESKIIHKLSKRALGKLRRRIGVIFQDFKLIPSKTAYENIAFAMEVTGKTDKEIHADVPYVLDLVGLANKMWNFPSELSGGEIQRVAIARAIVNQPDIIVADEPTGNLDPTNTYEIVQLLKKINQLGTTVIMTTHNKGVVDALGGRVITMKDGAILMDDTNGSYIL